MEMINTNAQPKARENRILFTLDEINTALNMSNYRQARDYALDRLRLARTPSPLVDEAIRRIEGRTDRQLVASAMAVYAPLVNTGEENAVS